jgi:hypothetical protein
MSPTLLGIGNPIPNSPIKLYYDFQYVDTDPPPTPEFEVTNGAQVIRVSVYDRDERLIRTLYNGVYPVGTMRIEWDKKISSSTFAPSGVYEVRFIVSGETRKSYPVTVDETITAVTDTAGAFTISDKHLPVGFYPVPQYSEDNSEYYGQFRITDVVYLEFITPMSSRAVLVNLTKGTISKVNIALE